MFAAVLGVYLWNVLTGRPDDVIAELESMAGEASVQSERLRLARQALNALNRQGALTVEDVVAADLVYRRAVASGSPWAKAATGKAAIRATDIQLGIV